MNDTSFKDVIPPQNVLVREKNNENKSIYELFCSERSPSKKFIKLNINWYSIDDANKIWEILEIL